MAKKSGEKSDVLVAQPHGGALKRGGTHHRPGRPPSAIRQAALSSLDKRLQVLATIADNAEARDADRIAAVKALASIGFGAGMPMSEVRQKLEATIALIEQTLPEPQAISLIMDIKRIWMNR